MNTKRRAKSCVRADFYCARAARLPALTVTTLRNVALREENRENKGAAHLNNAARSSAAQSKSFCNYCLKSNNTILISFCLVSQCGFGTLSNKRLSVIII